MAIYEGRGTLDPRQNARGKPLSEREMEVLKAVAREAGNGPAAYSLGISEQTVKNHVSVILAKTGAQNIAQAYYNVWLRDLWGESDAPSTDERFAAHVPPPSVCAHPLGGWEEDGDRGWTCGTCRVSIPREKVQ